MFIQITSSIIQSWNIMETKEEQKCPCVADDGRRNEKNGQLRGRRKGKGIL